MSIVKIYVEPDKNFSIYIFTGEISAEQIIASQEKFYHNVTTLYLLVDFTQADLSVLTSNDLRVILSGAKKNGHVREGGKTALLASDDLTFGMTRIYEILAEVHDLPFSVSAFRAKDEAMMWLLE